MATTEGYDLGTKTGAAFLTEHGFPVSDETLRRWADERKVRHIRTPGGQLRFRRVDLEALLAPVEPDPKAKTA